MPTAAVLIYNPVAGKIRSKPWLIPKLQGSLRRHLGELELLPTTGPKTAGSIARYAVEHGAQLVCVAGGDGTVNETASGMAGSGVPLLVLPAGTANVLGMETGLGGDAVRVAERYAELVAQDVALGTLEAHGEAPRLFAMMAGVGLDARIVRMVSPELKRRFGKLSYWQGGFAQVGKKLPEFLIRLDGGPPKQASFALVSRVKNYGGDLEIARHANLLADDFGVVLFEGPGSLRYLKYFSGVLLNQLDGMSGVTVARARTLEAEPLPGATIDVQVDGEHAGYAPMKVEVARMKLRLMLPASFVARAQADLRK
ncbi:MAG: NAD(+)/NADH kinase [Acidobacteria bacterium]|nr:NAD(+)/NADH kinase [Acidobacteriota bacterium]